MSRTPSRAGQDPNAAHGLQGPLTRHMLNRSLSRLNDDFQCHPDPDFQMRRLLAAAILPILFLVACGDSDPTGLADLPPTVQDISITLEKNESISQLLPVTDPEGAPLTYSLNDPPDHGTVSLVAASGGVNATYTPFQGFAGEDAFVYGVSDGVNTVQGRVDITVQDAPATGLSDRTFERAAEDGSSVNVVLSATDPDGDPLSFRVVRGPVGGTVTDFATTPDSPDDEPNTTTAVAVYKALPGFDEDDSFQVVATDGTNQIGPVTVTILVNDRPVAADIAISTPRSTPVQVPLTAQDADNDELTFEVTSVSPGGSLSSRSGTLTDGVAEVTFTPNDDFAGLVTIDYVVRDDLDTSIPAVARITVVNSAPVARAVSTSTDIGTPVLINLAGADADGDPLTFEIVRAPEGGMLGPLTQTGPNSATVTFTPASDTRGAVTFTYAVDDGIERSAPARVTIALPGAFIGLVANRNDNTVSVIDPAAGTIISTIAVGDDPFDVAVSPDGATALVANRGDNTISVIDIATLTLTGTISVSAAPRAVAFSPDGSAVYYAEENDFYTLDVDGLAEGGNADAFDFILDRGLTVSPDGTTLWIADVDWFAEYVIADGSRINRRDDHSGGIDIEFSPDGTRLYAANGQRVIEIDLSVTGTGSPERDAFDVIDTGGGAIAFSPDGTIAYATDVDANTVRVIDVATGAVVNEFGVGANPRDVGFAPDGETAYVVNTDDDTISIIDVASGAVTATIAAGDAPFDIAIAGGS